MYKMVSYARHLSTVNCVPKWIEQHARAHYTTHEDIKKTKKTKKTKKKTKKIDSQTKCSEIVLIIF